VKEVLNRYETFARAIPEGRLQLAGPTCFAPVIEEACRIVAEEDMAYHILVIIADGQVSDPKPTGPTARAIVNASYFPISIVVVGVGDGPWDTMEEFDDELPDRKFDNFQFVCYNDVLKQAKKLAKRGVVEGLRDSTESVQGFLDAQFALAALMEVPDQYTFIQEMGLLSSVPTRGYDPRNITSARASAVLPCPLSEDGTGGAATRVSPPSSPSGASGVSGDVAEDFPAVPRESEGVDDPPPAYDKSEPES